MYKCHLRCSRCGKNIPFELRGKCACFGTLLVEYDLEYVRYCLTKSELKTREPSLWRYHELLPVRLLERIVSLGEGMTPLLKLSALQKKLSLGQLWIKCEEQNPTGSFKARGLSVTISLLNEHGINNVAIPSNGNAASALAAYAGRAGMNAFVFLPQDCPGLIVEECIRYGASVYQVQGLIHDAAKIIEDGMREQEWFHAGTLREPGRVEGKKTMGFEIAEQLDWKLPDVIIYPTGGGSGIIGLWKAFHELRDLGWISSDLPRLVSVQEEGCTPIVEAMISNPSSELIPKCSYSSPTGMRVPNPPDGKLIVAILQETNGTALAVNQTEIADAQKTLGSQGISSSPEGAATMAALFKLRDSGWISSGEKVVLFNTAHAMKYSICKSYNIPLITDYNDFKQLNITPENP